MRASNVARVRTCGSPLRHRVARCHPALASGDDGSNSGSARGSAEWQRERQRERQRGRQAVERGASLKPGKGFLVGKTDVGELYISAYALVRYLNQMPAGQTFTDHLGRERPIDARHDILAHRIMVHLKGWIGLPKLVYQITLWTVNTTDQRAIFGVIGYQFHRAFSLYGGLNATPGHAHAARLAPVLARQRSRDGRRVLPPVLHPRRVGNRRAHCRASGTRR